MKPKPEPQRQGDARSATERAAAADPRCVPIRLDGPVPEGESVMYPRYPESDHEIWASLFRRQQSRLAQTACHEYRMGLARMGFSRDRIPALRDAARVLRETTGWSVARIPGLLHERDFFSFLARRVFPSTDYIRPRGELDYTPAPDLFHDVFGHLPMITDPEFADFYQRMGQAALAASGPDRRRVERFYWFTVEFGLIRTSEGTRIYGSGLLSSYGESRHCLTGAVERHPFEPDELTELDYDPSRMQSRLYVIESFRQLREGFDDWAAGRGLLPS